MVIGQQKGADTDENIRRNFEMPHPEGYRKAMRVMELGGAIRSAGRDVRGRPGAQTLPQSEVQETKKTGTKYAYSFGGGKADGNGKMKDDLAAKAPGWPK